MNIVDDTKKDNAAAKGKLRVVTGEEKLPENIYEDRINQIFEQCKKDCPITIFIAWETADNTMQVRSIPDSYSLQRGVAGRISALYFGDMEEVE